MRIITDEILKLPRRIERISGQNFSYVKLDDVLAALSAGGAGTLRVGDRVHHEWYEPEEVGTVIDLMESGAFHVEWDDGTYTSTRPENLKLAQPQEALPVAWMNADHIEAFRSGKRDGTAWASPVQSEFYTVPLLAASAATMTDQEYLIEKADEAFEARLARLIAAGYRLVAPGEVDPETVERCAQVAEAYEGKPCGPAQLWTEEQRQFFDAGQMDASTSIAHGVRALKGERDG